MTLDEAKKVARDPWNKHEMHTLVEAVIALSDALRSAEGQVAAMREAAAKAVDQALAEVSDGVMPVPSALTFANVVAARIRALPSPASAPTPGPTTPDDDVLTARFRAVHERLDAVEMYLRPLGFAAGRKP